MNDNRLMTYHLYIFDDKLEDKRYLTDFPLIAPKGITPDFLREAGGIVAHSLYEGYDGVLSAWPDEAESFSLELIKDGKHINPCIRVFIIGRCEGRADFLTPKKDWLSAYSDLKANLEKHSDG